MPLAYTEKKEKENKDFYILLSAVEFVLFVYVWVCLLFYIG